MFSPTSFPAAAWRVTRSLNVLPVTIVLHRKDWHDSYLDENYTGYWAEDLFPDRAAAVEHAVAMLAADEARVARAIARHARRRAMVKRVVAGGAK